MHLLIPTYSCSLTVHHTDRMDLLCMRSFFPLSMCVIDSTGLLIRHSFSSACSALSENLKNTAFLALGLQNIIKFQCHRVITASKWNHCCEIRQAQSSASSTVSANFGVISKIHSKSPVEAEVFSTVVTAKTLVPI